MLTMGITSILSSLAGRISAIRFKEMTTEIKAGSSVATIEGPRFFGVVRSPVDAVLIEANEDLKGSPRLVNESPYEKGWFVRLRARPGWRQSGTVKEAEAASRDLSTKVKELGVHCFAAVPDYEIFDIGVECSATIAHLNDLLAKASVGETVHLVTDDPTADVELRRWEHDTGQKVLEISREGNLFHFIVRRTR
jgi:glycine cleavage system H protein